jgi:hypothetical protein
MKRTVFEHVYTFSGPGGIVLRVEIVGTMSAGGQQRELEVTPQPTPNVAAMDAPSLLYCVPSFLS